MYWTDWGSTNPQIEKARMDGSEREVIINNKMLKGDKNIQIKWPNGLTIDFDTDEIYWCDAFMDIIVKMDLNGSKCSLCVS